MNSKKEINSQEDRGENNIFFVRELKERAEIKQKTKVFRARVDAEKKQELRRIEEDSKRRAEDISIDVSALEKALSDDDAEQIKAALKKLKI